LVHQYQKLRKMVEAIRQIHNTAMELSDLAKIKKARDGDIAYYENYMKAAFELELYAAMKVEINTKPNDQLWRATLLRSAGWLAYKCGYYEQALSLAEIGLEIPTDEYALMKLENLKKAVTQKLKKKSERDKTSELLINGSLFAVDMETNQINIREKNTKNQLKLIVSENRIQQIAKLFLGGNVEIDAKKAKNGQIILEDIRWAA